MIRINKLSKRLNTLSFLFLIFYVISVFAFSGNEQLNILSQILFIMFAFLTLITLFIYNNKIIIDKFQIFIFIFFLYTILSFFWSIDDNAAFQKISTLFQLFIMTLLLIFNNNIVKYENYVTSILSISGLVLTIYAYIFYGLDKVIYAILNGVRLGEEISQVNVFAIYVSIFFITCLYKIIYDKKYIFIFIAIFPFLLILSTISKKAILMIVFAYLMLLILKVRKRKRLIIPFIISIFIVLLPMLIEIPFLSNVIERLTYMLNIFSDDGVVDNSTLIRKNMIEIGIDLIKKRPLFGYGLDSFKFFYSMIAGGRLTYSHNNFIEISVNLGLFGLFIYYGLFYKVIKDLFHQIKKGNEKCILMFTILIVYVLIDIAWVSYYNKLTYILLVFGYIVSNHNKKKSQGIVYEINNQNI